MRWPRHTKTSGESARHGTLLTSPARGPNVLTPAETEKLLLSVVAMVARDRLERGILKHPEAVALLSCWVIKWAREGCGVADLMQEGRTVLNGACHH
jgi:hypothetical protein